MKKLFNLELDGKIITFKSIESSKTLDFNSMLKLLQELKLLGKKVILYNGSIYTIQEALSLIQDTEQVVLTAGMKEAIAQVEAQVVLKKKDSLISKDYENENATILKQLINNEMISEESAIPSKQEVPESTQNKALILDKTTISGVFTKSIDEDDSIFEKIQITNSLGKKLEFKTDSIIGDYGILELTNTNWSYRLNESLQKLNEGESVVDNFKIELKNGTFKIINITINGVNDAPILDVETSCCIEEDSSAIIDFNASDIDGTINEITANALHGEVLLNEDKLIYLPNKDYCGIDTITLNVIDNNGVEATKYISVNIKSVNDKPIVSLIEGYSKTIDEITLGKILDVPNSYLVISQDNILAATNITDVDSSSFEIILNQSDFSFNSNKDINSSSNFIKGVIQVDILFKMMNPDIDANIGDFLIFNTGFDSLNLGDKIEVIFYVNVFDGEEYSKKLPIEFTVVGSNDTPLIDYIKLIEIDEDSIVVRGMITSTDVDNNSILTYSTNSKIDGFTLNNNGSYEFNPNFYQYLNDGEILIITVPISVTDENGAQDNASLSIQIRGENDKPIIDSISSVNVYEDDVIVNGQITAIDMDIDSTYNFFTTVSLAGFILNSDGSYSFDPSHSDYQSLNIDDSLKFTIPIKVVDNLGASSTQNLIINLTGTNDYPTLTLDSTGATLEDTQTSINYTISDIDGTVGMIGSAKHGTVTINNDGTINYQPNANYNGQDTITVTVTDNNGASVTRTSTINVQKTNDAPKIESVTSNDLVEESIDISTIVGVVKASDIDEETVLEYSINGGNGYVEVDSSGNVTLTQVGVDAINLDTSNTDLTSFTYTVSVSDGIKTITTETQTIDITRINDNAPTVLNDTVSVDEDSTVSVDVLVNDSDLDDFDTLILDSVSTPTNKGTAIVVGQQLLFDTNGDFEYLAVGESEDVDVTYTVSDGIRTSTSTATITVTGVNDGPVSNEDLPIVQHTIEICSIGNDNPEISLSIRGVQIDGVSVPVVNQRGLIITVLDDDLNIILNERFDTYASLDDSNLLATKIEEIKAMDLNLKVIFTTSDEWTKNLNQNAKDALISIGANSEILNSIQMTSNEITYRSAYALVVDKVDDNYYNSFEEFSYRYGESINHTIEIGSLITTEDKVFYFEVEELLNNDTDFDNDTISLVSIENPTYNNVQVGTFEIVEIDGILKIKFMPNDNLDFLGNNESINIDFNYIIKDSHNSQDSVSSSLKINGVNDSVEFLDSSLEYLNINGSTVYKTNEVTQQIRTDELIKVDTLKTYKLSFDVTAGDETGNYNPTNNQYFGIVCYDIDGYEIRYEDSEHYGTGSYLTQDLNIGDTKIYIQDASDWYNGTVSGWSGLKWYGYENSNGVIYDDFTYSRNHEIGLWNENAIVQLEDGTYEITLNEPWNKDALSAGDAVANARLGMIFTYTNLVSDTTARGMTHDEAYLSDLHKYNGFRHGTQYVRVAGLVNWGDVNEVDSEGDIEGGVISYSNILFEEIALKEDLNTTDNSLTISGEISILDTDKDDTHLVSYEKSAETIGDLSLFFDETTKTITYNYEVDNSLVQYLNEREVLDEKFTINVENVDSNGNRLGTFTSKELIIQVAGTSDKPIVENVYHYQDEVVSGLQDIHGNVQLKEDLDANDSHKFYFGTPKVIVDGIDITAKIEGLDLTINQYNGYYKIVGDFNFLSKGQTADIFLDYYTIDSKGLKSDVKTINAEIFGVNDLVSINDNITDSVMTYQGNETIFVEGSTTKTMFNFQTDEYIKVDTSKNYNLTATIIAGDEDGNYNPTNTQFVGIACYDIDKNFIGHQNTNHYGTGSYLSQDLKRGDTKIYVQDASDWYDGNNSAYRGIAYYGYEDSTGYVYDDFTYTRNVFMKNYDENSIVQLEDGTYEITLNTPWNGDNLNAGDAIANATYGGGYNYNLLSGKTIPQGENTYSVSMTGIESNDRTEGYNDVIGFRSGTAYIKGLVLANYQDQNEADSEGDIGGGVIEYSNMQLQLSLLENSDKVEDGILTFDGNIKFTDLDEIENKISFIKENGTLGELILDLDSQNSQINYRYEINESLVDYLSNGEIKEEKFYIKIEDVDAQGNLLGTYSQKEISILIKGEDDNFVTYIDGRNSITNYIKNEESIFAGATSFDIEMTINSKINETSALLSYSVPSQSNEILIFTTSSGVVNLHFGGSSQVLGSTNILDGNTHDIRLTWESTTGSTKLYIDGVLDTEVIYKQNYKVSNDEGILVLGQEQDSNGGGFVASQAFSGEYSDISIITNNELKAHWKMDYITQNGYIQNQSSSSYNLMTYGDVNITKTLLGIATDGYILGATVFADANENGVLDEGEASDTTDIYGNYELSDAVGTLTLIGGVDISTNLMFNTVMSAPDGSTMITPYTTIIDKMMKLDDTISIEDANAILLEALSLEEGIDLLTLDALEEYESDTDLGLITQKIAVLILSMNAFIETFNGENGFELLALDAMTGNDFNFTNESWISSLVDTRDDRIIETISSINEAMLNSTTLEELVQIQIEASSILTDIQNGNIENYNTSDIEEMSDDNEVGLLTKEEISDLTESIEVSIVSYKVAGNDVEFIAGETVSLRDGEFTLYDNGEYKFVPNDETYIGALSEITYMTNIGIEESFTPSFLENLFENDVKINNIETYHTNIISLDIEELITDSKSLDFLLNYIKSENNVNSVKDTQIINNLENYQTVEAEIIENFASLNPYIDNLMQIDVDMF